MKSAIYLENGDTQLYLEGENEWEKRILDMLHDAYPQSSYRGEFYECRGGWYREGSCKSGLIFRLKATMGKMPRVESSAP